MSTEENKKTARRMTKIRGTMAILMHWTRYATRPIILGGVPAHGPCPDPLPRAATSSVVDTFWASSGPQLRPHLWPETCPRTCPVSAAGPQPHSMLQSPQHQRHLAPTNPRPHERQPAQRQPTRHLLAFARSEDPRFKGRGCGWSCLLREATGTAEAAGT